MVTAFRLLIRFFTNAEIFSDLFLNTSEPFLCYCLPFCKEFISFTDHFRACHDIDMIRHRCCKEFPCNHDKYSLFILRKLTISFTAYFRSRDNCMVITYFPVIHYSPNVRSVTDLSCKFHLLENPADYHPGFIFHIFCQIIAVRSWICRQFFLVQALGTGKCSLGCHAKYTVTLPLERCQVIELRCFYHLPFLFTISDPATFVLAGKSNPVSLGFIGNMPAYRVKTISFQVHNEVFFFPKPGNCGIPCNNHGKCRRLNPSDSQRLLVKDRKKTAHVDAYQPVSLFTAER